MQSKQVLDSGKSAETVAQSAETHAPVIAKGVTSVLAPYLKPGEKMPDVDFLLTLHARAIRGSFQLVATADAANEAELADDPSQRAERDALAATLYARLTGLRGALASTFGDEAATLIGFDGPTTQDPVALAALGVEVAKRLPKLASKKPVLEGVTISLDTLGRGLAEQAGKLDAANKATGREKKEAEQTLVAKQREVARHGRLFRGSASSIEGLARLAGEDDLADRVRPSPTRAGVTESDPEPTPSPATP